MHGDHGCIISSAISRAHNFILPYLSRVLDPQPHPHSILVGLLHRNRTLRQRLKVHTSLSREILQLLPVTSCSRGVD